MYSSFSSFIIFVLLWVFIAFLKLDTFKGFPKSMPTSTDVDWSSRPRSVFQWSSVRSLFSAISANWSWPRRVGASGSGPRSIGASATGTECLSRRLSSGVHWAARLALTLSLFSLQYYQNLQLKMKQPFTPVYTEYVMASPSWRHIRYLKWLFTDLNNLTRCNLASPQSSPYWWLCLHIWWVR